jgi:hypothetical protein
VFTRLGIATLLIATSSTAILPLTATATTLVKVTIENLAPSNGTFLTPVWVGFHDGQFDLYDRGSPASIALERLAEDGNTAVLSADFTASGAGTIQGAIGNAPIAPGTAVTSTFKLDESLLSSRYFSYASMVVPSNDFFIANDNPLAHRIFDNTGTFLGADFIILGANVLDAGTEVNDEIPANTAFFGQQTPNTGTDEGGVVRLASEFGGFQPAGSGGILDDPRFANADFTALGYQVARIRIQKVQVPESNSIIGLFALGGLCGLQRLVRKR